MIHLRTVTDERGDAIENLWFCSNICYNDSFSKYPITEADENDRVISGVEKGGAYPCGSEHDLPDYCATCSKPIGNPLTSEGEKYVREFVLSEISKDNPNIPQVLAEQLKAEYSYLFHPLTERN